MSRLLSFAVFFGVLTLLTGLVHAYFWSRLVRAPGWPAPWQAVGTAAVVVLALLVPVAVPVSRLLPREWAGGVSAVAFTWMGLGFLLFVALVLADLVAWAGPALLATATAAKGEVAADPARRELLARGVAGAATLAAAGMGGVALRNAVGSPAVTEVEVRLERLPPALSGLTLVQLSDVHVGPTIGRRFIEDLVERTNALQPDVVVITGDLVDGSVGELAHHVEPLRQLRARHGVYFVTGNHEYYSGAEEWVAHLPTLGVRVLRNERVAIGDERGWIDLAGVNDYKAGSFGDAPDLERALAGRDPARELVLLAHQPAEIENAARLGVGLQLSGHTHGGQIWPFGNAVRLAQPYVSGLHRHGPQTQIYVSCGTGYWGPPMRLGAPSEITKIVLRPAAHADVAA